VRSRDAAAHRIQHGLTPDNRRSIHMELDIAGRTALVTGASRGIGYAIAECFVREGVNVHIVARTAADVESACAKLRGAGKVKVTGHALDLGLSASVAQIAERCGDVDILVNNAGAIPQGDLIAVDEARWREAWELKVFGYINLTREIYRRMIARKDGVIVNVVGVSGERLRADYIAGSTGNAAMMAFSKTLGGQSVDYGVRVVAVNPGQIVTDRLLSRLTKQAQEKLGDANRWPELAKNAPLGRYGRPEEIADVVVFLASPRASYVSGTVVTIDAGRAVRNSA